MKFNSVALRKSYEKKIARPFVSWPAKTERSFKVVFSKCRATALVFLLR